MNGQPTPSQQLGSGVTAAANFHLNLTKHESPEHVTLKMDKAREMGLPYPFVAQLDNNDLTPPLSADTLAPQFQKYLADNVYKTPMFRDQLQPVDRFVRSLVRMGQTRQQVTDSLNKVYEESGVPYPRRLDLEQRGYKEIAPGKYLKDGSILKSVASQTDIAGPEERKLVEGMLDKIRTRTGIEVDDLGDFHRLSEAGKKLFLGSYAALQQQENALLTALMEGYGSEWRDMPDHTLRGMVERIGREENVDLSHISLDRLRKGGVSSVDFAQALNFFGAVDFYRFATRRTPEEIAAIDENSPIEDQLAKIEYLKQYSLEMRGRTVGAQTVQTIASALPFITEVFATGGLTATARQGGKVALKTAVAGTLKDAGFDSIRGGARALFTKQGWKGIGSSLGMVAKGEAKRLPLYAPRDFIRALDEAEAGPVYYMRDGVKMAIPEADVELAGDLVFKNLLSTYIQNTSEYLGEFLPSNLALGSTAAQVLPKKWKAAVGNFFLADLAKDTTKMAKLSAAFSGAAPIEGVLGEMAEEWAAAGLERVSTILGEALGSDRFDMGRDSVFGSSEEQQVILWSSIAMSGAFSGVNTMQRAARYRDVARWVDQHREATQRLSETPLEQRSPASAQEFIGDIREGEVVDIQLTPEDADALFQSDPELMGNLGVTEDDVAKAKMEGSLIDVPEDKLIVEQAKSPAAYEAGERVLEKARFSGDAVASILSSDFGKEILDSIDSDRNRLEKVQQTVYSKLAVGKLAGLSSRALRAASFLVAAKVIHLQDNFASPEEIDRAVDNLLLKVYKEDSQFLSDKETLEYLGMVVDNIAPEAIEAPAPEQETADSTDAGDWVVPDDVTEKWDADIRRYISKRLGNPKNDNIRQYLDDSEMYSAAMSALNKAYSNYDPDAGNLDNLVWVAVKNRILDLERKAARMVKRGVQSLDEEIGEDGATRADVIPDANAVQQGTRLSEDERVALQRAIDERLTDKQREIWNRTLEGKTQSEIKDELGVSAQYVSKVVAAVRAIAKEVAMRHLGIRGQESPDSTTVKRGFFKAAANFDTSFRAVIGLFKRNANASTLVHESAHWLYQMMESLVEMQGEDGSSLASEQLRSEFDAINKWLDRQKYKAEAGTKEWEIERDEKFARAFEYYVINHRAPSSIIAAAFHTLKRFLTAIYRHCAALPELYGFEMSNDIVQVFDQILAVDEIVKRDSPLHQAALNLDETFATLFGANAEERKEAADIMSKARASIIAGAEYAHSAVVTKLRRVWRKTANEAMRSMRVYKAWRAAEKRGKDNDNRLDMGLLTEMVSPEAAKALKDLQLAKEGGQDPALLAGKLGYTSPAEMVSDLLSALPPTEFVEAYMAKAEAKFDAEYELGAEAMGTKANIQLVELLIDKLREKTNAAEQRERRAAIVEKARKIIAQSSVDWILNDKKAIAALKAANRDLISAFSKEDYLKALEHAETVRLNLEVLRQKADAKHRAEVALRKIKHAMRAPQGRIHGDYQTAIKELAYHYGVTGKEPDNPDTNYRKKLVGPSDVDNEIGSSPAWPNELLDDAMRDYRVMEFSDFETFADFVDFLYSTGREIVSESKTALHNQERAIRDPAIELLMKQDHKYHSRKDTAGDKVVSTLRRLWTMGYSLRARFARADGYTHIGEDATVGPLMQLWNILNEASSRALTLIDRVEHPCKEAVQELYDLKDQIKLPAVPFTGKAADYYSKWTPERVVSACLNMGNEINRQRLRDGFGWTEDQLTEIASCLPKAAWDAVQKIWDALAGELQTKVADTFLRENHYRLKLVPANAFSVRTADGEITDIRGGYYPLKYSYAPAGKAVDMAEDLRGLHNESRLLYKKVDSLQKRAESLREVPPLKLSMGVPLRHIHDAAMYAEMRMPLRVALGVICDKTFRDEFQRTQSYEAYQDVYSIIRNMANPLPETEGVLDNWESWARTVLTASALMGNLRTVGMQLTSATIGIQELGSYYADAVSEFAASPGGLTDFVGSKSAMMKNRSSYFDIDLRTKVDAFSSKLSKVQTNFARVGYWGMHAADGVISTVLWTAKYRQALDLLQKQQSELSPADIEAKAVAEADGFIARTQGAARTIDTAPIRLTRAGRLLSPFLAPANAQFNTMVETLGAVRAGRLSYDEAFAAIAGNILVPSLLTGVVTWLTTRKDEDDDENTKLWARVARDVLTNPFSGIPIIGNAINAVTSGLINSTVEGAGLYQGDLLDPGYYQSVSKLFSGIVSGGRAVTQGEWARATWVWADVLSTAYGMPVLKIYKRALDTQRAFGLDTFEFQEELEEAISPNKKGAK